MTGFVCERCNYATEFKGNLKLHLTRMNPCVPKNRNAPLPEQLLVKYFTKEITNPFVCKCGKKYSYQSGLSVHQRHCETYINHVKLQEYLNLRKKHEMTKNMIDLLRKERDFFKYKFLCQSQIDLKDVYIKCFECDRYPLFNFTNESNGIFCHEHKKNGMVAVICMTPLCHTRITNKKYNGYCLRCFMYMFPDQKIVRNYKTKEATVVDYIKSHFSQFTFITDKSITDGCSRKRPDILVDFGEFVLIIEIDENQHTSYSCENKRLCQLSQDIGHRPLVMIRFNPDEYIDENNSKVASCWTVNKSGICIIDQIEEQQWMERLTTLKEEIQKVLETKHEKTIEVIHLFYNKG